MSTQAAASASAIPSNAIFYLSLAAFGNGVSIRMTDAMLPHLSGTFSISLASASNIITVFTLAYGVAQLFFGPLGDRFGKYRVIGWSCIACGVTATMCGMAPNYHALLAARLLAGATAAAVLPLSMAWIGDVIDYDRRQPVLARFLIGQILGVSAGIWIGGFTADHLAWNQPFLALGAGYFAISLALMAVDRRLPEHARMLRSSSGNVVRNMVTEFRQVLVLPWARIVLAAVFLEGAFLFGGLTFVASHLHRVHGISLSSAGSIVMLFGFGGFLFAASSAMLVRRLGEIGLARWGGALVFGAFLAVGLAPAWQWAIPGCFIAGLGFYMLHNTLQTNATQMAPERRGVAVSAFSSFYMLGQALGVAVGGRLVETLGTGAVITAFGFATLLVALNFGRLRKRSLQAT
jgi:predicted MFS family arabinose efflux permease